MSLSARESGVWNCTLVARQGWEDRCSDLELGLIKEGGMDPGYVIAETQLSPSLPSTSL